MVIKYFLVFVCFLASASCLWAQSAIVPQRLRCEYLNNPQGIDESAPRLSWEAGVTNSKNFGQRQTAYKILVSQTLDGLDKNEGDIWNSGWVNSGMMNQIVYGGKSLLSDKTYYWKVCLKDQSGKPSAWSKPATWSTGLFLADLWTAKWIGSGIVQDSTQKECSFNDPWFRKTFTLQHQPIKATLFLASVGYHELYVNGKKITADVLSPCVSDESKRARYIAYNIAHDLKPGINVIAVWLGTSWSIYSSYQKAGKPAAPIFIAQADIYNNTGKLSRVETDDTWRSHDSPNRLLGSWSFGNMGGELFDATKTVPDWNLATLDDRNWRQAVVYRPDLTLSAQMVEPNQLFHEIRPVSVQQIGDSAWRVDMGVNFAGWVQIGVKGKPGHRIDFLFSEREKHEMTFNNHSAYIIDTTGSGTFRNRFNYGSGRWITIKGPIEPPVLSAIKGWVVRTAYEDAATFRSSDSLQNWIYNKVKWNFENLSLGGYVVDCPQRERLGYGGDAHATSESGMFNYQLAAFYTKWMEDWRDVQGTQQMDPLNYGGSADEGILPHTAPTYQGGGGPAWGGICVTLPWLMYQHFGDTRVLKKNFSLIKKWLAFLDSHVKDDLLVRFGGDWDFLGDWLWPNATAEGMNNGKPENICFNNCYRVYNLRTAAKIARVIGENEAANGWEQQAEITSAAIRSAYYNEGNATFADSSMGNLAAALLAEVPTEVQRPKVMQRLEKEILVIRKGHIHAGITGGAMLFKLLRQEGRDDLLYSMSSQLDYPGWGYMKAGGATSLWEMWEKDLPGHSLLHSSFLYPGAWYIDGLSGIRKIDSVTAFREFAVRPPVIGGNKLSWCKTSYHAPSGRIHVFWRRENGTLRLDVTVPAGAKAVVHFPAKHNEKIWISSPYAKNVGFQNGCQVFQLVAGSYHFSGKEQNGKLLQARDYHQLQ